MNFYQNDCLLIIMLILVTLEHTIGYRQINYHLTQQIKLICSLRKRWKNIRVQLGNVELAQTGFFKYLGVYIDQHLAWNAHITFVSHQISNKCRYSFKYKALSRFKYSQASLLFSSLPLFTVDGARVWANTYPTRLRP